MILVHGEFGGGVRNACWGMRLASSATHVVELNMYLGHTHVHPILICQSLLIAVNTGLRSGVNLTS